MACLNNTIVNGNTRVNGLLSTNALMLNGTNVTLASDVASGGSGLVTAAMVKAFITGNAVTPSRSGNTVTWGTGWVTASSSTGDTTTRSASTGSIAAISGVTLGNYLTTTATGNVGGFVGNGNVSTGTGWITSGTTTSNNSSTYYIKKGTAGAVTGGGLSGATLSVTDKSITGSNVTLGDTNNGISVTMSAKATRTKVVRAAASYSITTAGWISSAGSALAADDGATLGAASSSADTLTKYISALTVPASKTLSSVTLTSGTSNSRTYLTTLTVNGYTTINTLNLSGIIESLPNSGGIISSYSGDGTITNYSNTGGITTMTGGRTITNLGTSTTAGSINITTNTYGTVNISGGKTANGGVTVAGKVVTVDGDGTNAGTAVTNSSGDLITTSATRSGNKVSWGTGWITESSSTGATTSASRSGATVSWGTGWITENSITVPDGTLSVAASDANTSSYTEVTSGVVVPAGGWLLIGAGYYPNKKISLATLIPDDGNYTNAGSGQLRKNYEAYDTNGNKLIGTINDFTPSTDYYTTTNTGLGGLTGGTYLTGTRYIIAGTAGDISGGGLSKGTASGGGLSGGGLSKGTASGGGLSGGGLSQSGNSGGGLTWDNANVSTSSTDNGIRIKVNRAAFSNTVSRAKIDRAAFSQTVTRAKIDRAAFSQTVTRAAASYSVSAGWVGSAGSGLSETSSTVSLAAASIDADSSTVSLAADSIAADSSTVSLDAGSTTLYVTGITVPNTKNFSLDLAGSGTITLTSNGTTASTKTINIYGGKTANRGFSIENRVVTVDGDGTNAGTAVTNSNGDLITTSRSASTGRISAISGVTLGDYLTTTSTGNVGGFVGNGDVSTGTGWISSGTTTSSNSSTYYIKKGTAGAISGGGLSGGAPSVVSKSLSGSNVTLGDTNNGISVTMSAKARRAAVTRAAASYSITTAGWISSAGTGLSADSTTLGQTDSSADTLTKYISDITVPTSKTLSSVTNKGTITTVSNQSGNIYVHNMGGTVTYESENGSTLLWGELYVTADQTGSIEFSYRN